MSTSRKLAWGNTATFVSSVLNGSKKVVETYTPTTIQQAVFGVITGTIQTVQTYGPDAVAIVENGVHTAADSLASTLAAAGASMSRNIDHSPQSRLKEAIDNNWTNTAVEILQQEPGRLLEHVPDTDGSPLFIEYIALPSYIKQLKTYSQAISYCFMLSVQQKNFICIALIIKNYPNILTKSYVASYSISERSFFIHALLVAQNDPDCFRAVLGGFKILLASSDKKNPKWQALLDKMTAALIHHAKENPSTKCLEIFKEVLPDLHDSAFPKSPSSVLVTAAPAVSPSPPNRVKVVKIINSNAPDFNPCALTTHDLRDVEIIDSANLDASKRKNNPKKNSARQRNHGLQAAQPSKPTTNISLLEQPSNNPGEQAPEAMKQPSTTKTKPRGRTRHYRGPDNNTPLNPTNNQIIISDEIPSLTSLQKTMKMITDMPLSLQFGLITTFLALLTPATLAVSVVSSTAGIALGGTGGLIAVMGLFSACKNYKKPSCHTPNSTSSSSLTK